MNDMNKIVESGLKDQNELPFFVFNIEDLILKHKKWVELMPRVVPFYAVKCNNHPLVLELLSGLGLSFDCSSKIEIQSILNCGVSPTNIILANCCKTNQLINYSRSVGVDLMTFDNEDELFKIKEHFPSARLVLRIKADDRYSTSRVGLKFGAEVNDFENLFEIAKNLGLNVIGISFHVGSGCQRIDPYEDAIKKARIAFNIGINLGFKMNLLDIGGGFPGSDRSRVSFEEIASFVSKQLEKYFPSDDNLSIIAEPGRYYAMSAFNLFTSITSRRVINTEIGKEIMYYMNDGLYGSFSSVITGHKVVEPIPIARRDPNIEDRDKCQTVLWGPTCDSYDCVRRDFQMSELFVGEWIRFQDMGSYSLSAATHFNDMPLPYIRVFVSDMAKKVISELKNKPKIEELIGMTGMASV